MYLNSSYLIIGFDYNIYYIFQITDLCVYVSVNVSKYLL